MSISSLGNIELRLRASVRMDAINGNSFERSVCSNQMLEAAKEIERLRAEVKNYETRVIELEVAFREEGAARVIDMDLADEREMELKRVLKIARPSEPMFCVCGGKTRCCATHHLIDQIDKALNEEVGDKK